MWYLLFFLSRMNLLSLIFQFSLVRFRCCLNYRDFLGSGDVRGSINKYLENPRDGARSIGNSLVLVSIITHWTAVKVSVISISTRNYQFNTIVYLQTSEYSNYPGQPNPTTYNSSRVRKYGLATIKCLSARLFMWNIQTYNVLNWLIESDRSTRDESPCKISHWGYRVVKLPRIARGKEQRQSAYANYGCLLLLATSP